jgi:hypothetical protein
VVEWDGYRSGTFVPIVARPSAAYSLIMFLWVYQYPTWQMALLFAAGFGAFAIAGTIAVRRLASGWLHREEPANEHLGVALGSFSVLYGLLLGLLAVASFQNFSNTEDLETKEASSLIAAYRDSSGLPDPQRTQLQTDLRQYTRETIDIDWPLQKQGVVPTHSTEMFGRFFSDLQSFNPSTPRETNIHAEALRQANNLSNLRRERLVTVKVGLPNIMWWVVLVGAFINMALLWMFNMERHIHVLISGLLSVFLGMVIFLIAAMDYPYRGEVSITPESFEQVYAAVMQ